MGLWDKKSQVNPCAVSVCPPLQLFVVPFNLCMYLMYLKHLFGVFVLLSWLLSMS